MTPISTIQSLVSRDALPVNFSKPPLIPAKELQDVRPLVSLDTNSNSQPVQGSAPGSFANLLGNLISETNQKQVAAGQAVQGLLSGENVPLHEAVIAMEEASVSMQLMVEVRNKMLESYQELMRMQI
jgi:flagellar hook-basal body complex protein FliE